MTDQDLIEAVLAWRQQRHTINATTFTIKNSDAAHREASSELYDVVDEYAKQCQRNET